MPSSYIQDINFFFCFNEKIPGSIHMHLSHLINHYILRNYCLFESMPLENPKKKILMLVYKKYNEKNTITDDFSIF